MTQKFIPASTQEVFLRSGANATVPQVSNIEESLPGSKGCRKLYVPSIGPKGLDRHVTRPCVGQQSRNQCFLLGGDIMDGGTRVVNLLSDDISLHWSPPALLDLSNRVVLKSFSLVVVPEIAIPSPTNSNVDLNTLGRFLQVPKSVQYAWWHAYRRWHFPDTPHSWTSLKEKWRLVNPRATDEEWNELCRGAVPGENGKATMQPLRILYQERGDIDDQSWPQNSIWCPRYAELHMDCTPSEHQEDKINAVHNCADNHLHFSLDTFAAPVSALQPLSRPCAPEIGISQSSVIWNGVNGHTFCIIAKKQGSISMNPHLPDCRAQFFTIDIRRIMNRNRLNQITTRFDQVEPHSSEIIVLGRPQDIGQEFGEYDFSNPRRYIGVFEDDNSNRTKFIRLSTVSVGEEGNYWAQSNEMEKRRATSEALRDLNKSSLLDDVRGRQEAELLLWREFDDARFADKQLEYEYVLVNQDPERRNVTINGKEVRYGEIAGPLPEFAVIIVPSGQECFWWGVKDRDNVFLPKTFPV